MFRLLAKNRRGTHNILSTLIIFLLMTLGVTYVTVQVRPVLETLQKGTSEKTQEAVFYSLAESIDGFIYAPEGSSKTTPINNPLNLRYQLDTSHSLQIGIQGTANTPSYTYSWGFLNATLFQNKAQRQLPPYLYRGGSGYGFDNLINAKNNPEGENTIFFIQQLSDGTVQYVVVPRIIATTVSSRTGFADLTLYVTQLVILDDGTGNPVGFPNDLSMITLNMTVSQRTVSTQSLGQTNDVLTITQNFDGRTFQAITFPDIPTGTIVTLRTISIIIEVSTL